LIISAAAGYTNKLSADQTTINPSWNEMVATVMYIIGYLWCIAVLAVLLWAKSLSGAPRPERKIAWFTAAVLPFICVRIVWAILSSFIHNDVFNVFGGSIVAYTIMAPTMELAVVILYLVLGFSLESLGQAVKVEALERASIGEPPLSRRERGLRRFMGN